MTVALHHFWSALGKLFKGIATGVLVGHVHCVLDFTEGANKPLGLGKGI